MTRQHHGFALLDLIFVCGIIGLLMSIALPRLLMAKAAAGSPSAIGSMRAINSAELTFALTCGAGFYAPNLSTLGTAPPGSHEPFILPGLGAANVVMQSGYQVQIDGAAFDGAPASCNGLGVGTAARGYRAAADSIEPSNKRFFATNVNGLIYEDSSSLFAAMPEVGEPAAGHPINR